MNKIGLTIIIGAIINSLFALEGTGSGTQNGAEQAFQTLPDSIRAKISEHNQKLSSMQSQMQQQRAEWEAKINKERDVWQTKIASMAANLPDTIKAIVLAHRLNELVDAELPDSLRLKVTEIRSVVKEKNDSLHAIIDQRRLQAKVELEKEIAKLNADQRAKLEKILANIQEKLKERQTRAEEAQKKLQERQAEIQKMIELTKASEKLN
jgi:hypothetical protein